MVANFEAVKTETVERFSLEALNDRLPEEIDVFIACASFEARCLSIARHLGTTYINRSIVLHNKGLESLIEPNLITLSGLLEKYGEVTMGVLDLDDPIANDDALSGELKAALPPEGGICVVDISTFPREVLLLLLNRLRSLLAPSTQLILVYNDAANYSGQQSNEQKWLSRGVRDVRSVVGFPGEMLPSRRTHLMVMSGYENDRAIKLVERFEPHFLSIGCPPPEGSINVEFYECNVYFRKKVTTYFRDIDEFTFSARDPFATRDALLAHAATFPSENIVIAPLNTKISTVGAALATFDRPDIQLCYAQGNIYNYTEYSTPGKDCYWIEMPGFELPLSL